jgi:pimeloyl-ACP methyl ester carboxylesterase
MPLAPVQYGSCYYRVDGPDDRPVIVLSHSLGLDHGMWDQQAADLQPHFCVLRYDTRGHGASSAPPGDYTIAELAGDVLALVDTLGIRSVAFCGLSLGGMIGQWLAVNAADRLTHLVLANTSPRLSDPSTMETRRRLVLSGGMAAVES